MAKALRRRLQREPDLLPGGHRVLVALSGGRDSVVLLHLLKFGAVARCDVSAAHFDHAMRPGSEGDRAWARGLARAWAVPFESARAGRPPRSEAEARSLRYAFLHEAAHRAGATRIATAHHADDQVETVLMRILRGTGPAGLAGIPSRRGPFVRPLLPFSGRRLGAYVRATGLRWREDPTNVDTRLARNRIRHVLLPALEAAAPGTRRAASHLARRAAEAEQVLHPLIDAAQRLAVEREGESLVLARGVMLAYDPWVRARVLREVLHRAGARLDRSTILRADSFLAGARSGATLQLGGGLRLVREFEQFVLTRPIARPADRALHVMADAGSGRAGVGGAAVRAAWGPRPPAAGTTVALDRAALAFPLILRGWRPGDRIRLVYGSKKLKKLFTERRLARADRIRVPVLADAAGHVLWIAGLAVAAPALARTGHTTLYFTVLE